MGRDTHGFGHHGVMSHEDRVRDVVEQVAGSIPGPALPTPELEVIGNPSLASCFDVDTAAVAAAALTNLAAGCTTIDGNRVAALFSTHVEIDGAPVPKWGDLSGYYETGDGGFIQFHCNFPHHADGVLRRLGCEPTREAVQEAVLGCDPRQLEADLIADGMVAARMRSLHDWSAHPHAAATEELPLITVDRIADGAPRNPARRLRVLDCSRVLAGPVAGMTMAAHGADVLRIGAARLPSVEVGVIATGFGKRNAHVDLATGPGRGTFAELLEAADVWIDAYRPGALAGLGFPVERVAPGSVVIQLCAFDWVGPWAGRRGFDSIVQTTSGVAAEGMVRAGRDRPTPLPVQALDYCTGLLAGFAAQQLTRHQAEVGGTWLARLSLLRTRNWLVDLAPPVSFEPSTVRPDPAALQTVATAWGAVTAARPIGGRWTSPPRPLGTSPPRWEEN